MGRIIDSDEEPEIDERFDDAASIYYDTDATDNIMTESEEESGDDSTENDSGSSSSSDSEESVDDGMDDKSETTDIEAENARLDAIMPNILNLTQPQDAPTMPAKRSRSIITISDDDERRNSNVVDERAETQYIDSSSSSEDSDDDDIPIVSTFKKGASTAVKAIKKTMQPSKPTPKKSKVAQDKGKASKANTQDKGKARVRPPTIVIEPEWQKVLQENIEKTTPTEDDVKIIAHEEHKLNAAIRDYKAKVNDAGAESQRKITDSAFSRLPDGALLRDDQKKAIQNCISSMGHLVIAHTGWGKTMLILGVAVHFADKGEPVMILARASTVAEFQRQINRFDPVPNITLMTHENFVNKCGPFVRDNGRVSRTNDGNRLRDIIPDGTVLLVDECQKFASDKLLTVQNEMRKMPYVAMAVCAAQASRVYLFSATPCLEKPDELKSLLYMVKRIPPPSLRSAQRNFDQMMLSDFAQTAEGQVVDENLDGRDETAITFNWKCLVSYYMPDQSAADYLKNWINLKRVKLDIPMTPSERAHFEDVERRGGWEHFAGGARKASETSSKMQAMFRVLKAELHRFDGTGIKPRIMIYTYLRDYAEEIQDALNKHLEFRQAFPIYLRAGHFNVNSRELQPFVMKDGESKIAIITDAGVTGFDPPPLTAIIAMNAFWTPGSRLQLEGRLNRYRKHTFMEPILDRLHRLRERYGTVYQLRAVKEEGETGDDPMDGAIPKAFGFDARQDYIVNGKAAALGEAFNALNRASVERNVNMCTNATIAAKLNSDIEFLNGTIQVQEADA